MFGIKIERNSHITISRQIYQNITGAILANQLCSGETLPSSRDLAKQLNVARNTVSEAYEMLKVEGYISSRAGSRCRVKTDLFLSAQDNDTTPQCVLNPPKSKPDYDFRTGIPDISQFPFHAWNQLQNRTLEYIDKNNWLYGGYQGYFPLREEIASWLFRTKGIVVSPDDIFIAAGATHAINLIAEILKDKPGKFYLENPCHLGILKILQLKNMPYQVIDVDNQGLQVNALQTNKISCVYVTPSHQFPLGFILPARRRVELIRLAREEDFYVLEDDYDGEFRYDSLPITPLYAMDREHVIYVGTFSKSLFPALRIGFALLPSTLREKWIELRQYSDIQNPIVEQVVLAEFLKTRKMDRYIRLMNKTYANRQVILVKAIQDYFPNNTNIIGEKAGLHLAIQVPGFIFDHKIQLCCKERGIALFPCSMYALGNQRYDDTLLLGYGNISNDNIVNGVKALSQICCL